MGSISEIMTIEELAKYLKISKSSMYKLCQEGKIPGHKVGRHWRFQREVIDEWLAEQSKGSNGSKGSDASDLSMDNLKQIVDEAISVKESKGVIKDEVLGKIVDDIMHR